MGKYSEYKGVTKINGFWQAQINYDGKTRYIGAYRKEIDAVKAYNAAVMTLYKNKDLTNPIPGDKDYGKRPALKSRRGARIGRFVDISPWRKTSRFKGVYWNKDHNSWIVDINRYDLRYQKFFDNEINAALHYNEIMIDKYGDKVKCHLNIIPGIKNLIKYNRFADGTININTEMKFIDGTLICGSVKIG